MKKLIFVLALLIFAFTACGGNTEEPAQDYTQTDAATATPTEAIAEPAAHIPTPPPTPTPEPTPTPTPEVEVTILYSMAADEHIQGLEEGTSGGLVFNGTPYLAVSGGNTSSIVPNPDGGNSILVANRNSNSAGVDILLAPMDITYGAIYHVRITGRAAVGTIMLLGRTDTPWGGGMIQEFVPASEIWYFDFPLPPAQLMDHFISQKRGIRIMTVGSTNEYTIDNIEFVRLGERGYDEPVYPEWDLTIPSLAGSFAEFFLFGNIWSTQTRMDTFNTNEGFLHHFNTVTAENNHKVDSIASNPDPERWNFTTADHIVEWAEESELAMVGHTLSWHGQSPTWLSTVPGTTEPLTRAEAIENMHLYISTVAARYSGRMFAWDVLNEAIWGAGATEWRANPDWRAYMRSAGRGLNPSYNTQWYNAFANGADIEAGECGSDYVFYAFRFARIYDPFAVLYYNDYNDHVPGKRDAIAQMVVEINERWREDPLYDGRLLIEGIGMQAHYGISGWMTNPSYVRSAIELYITTGARLSITEWDVSIGGSRGDPAPQTPARMGAQADRFALLTSFYLEFSDYIERITVWGMTDHWSWVSHGSPVLFDAQFQAKQAFYAVIGALEDAAPANISVPEVLTEDVPNAVYGQHFAFGLEAFRTNFAPIRWHVVDGYLPEGLRVVAATGVILGTPTESGSFTFTIQASNAAGAGQRTFTMVV
ncbi:MAG: endo-1,4-beta-xylanase [Defluviitaleaceae bacterium]|nr:endo-1,4-beta-xylanase [Defluviitaleaceae bacterium]